MTIKKFTTVLTADATVALPEPAIEMIAMAVTSASDATVSVAVTDYNSRTVATWAAADYTTRTLRSLGPVETDVYDTGGDPSANTEHQPIGVLVDAPIAVAFGGTLGADYVTVEIYYRSVAKASVVLSTTNATGVVTLPDGLPLHRVLGMAVTSSSDTSVSLAVTDAASKTIATWASADYTTRALRYLAEVESAVYDAGGDASADTEGNDIGVFADGALSIAASGMAAGTFTVEVYFEE